MTPLENTNVENDYCKYNGESSGFVRIHVEDTGIGISKEGISKLFKPFAQASKDISKKFGGTGIGLWLSQSIMNLLNGTIKIKSEEGKGSIFTVSFPVKIANTQYLEAVPAGQTSALEATIE